MATNSEIKSFAGVASIQTMIRSAAKISKEKVLEHCLIDGMVGPNTFNALNFIASYVFGSKAHVPQGHFRLEDGLLVLQRWYEGIRNELPAHRRMVWERLECDGVWGTETYNAFHELIRLYCEMLFSSQNKVGDTKLRPRHTSRPFIGGDSNITPPRDEEKVLGPREIVYMSGAEDDPQTLSVLARAMGWANAVITPAQLLTSPNNYGALISRHTETKETLGILVYTKPHRPTRMYDFNIVGIYVQEGYRNASIGTSLVGHLKTIADNQNTDVSFYVSAIAPKSHRAVQFLTNMQINKK